jgi:hypothetical protein
VTEKKKGKYGWCTLYASMKPVETAPRRGRRMRENDDGGEPNQGTV